MHVKKIAFLLVLFVVAVSFGTAMAEKSAETLIVDDVVSSLDIDDDICIILYDSASGEILFEQNADTRTKTASTAKLLTCVVALENCSLDENVTISNQSATCVGSSLQLKRNEKLPMGILLNGMMVVSGNDAANAVAEHIAGSQREFAKLMNETAGRIGMDSSHFTNSIGISDRNNYSTARDMMSLALYAMRNEQLMQFTGQSTFEMPETNKNEARIVYSTNLFLYKESELFYEYATGLKTGSSSRGKGNLVATAVKDGIDLVCVVMNDRSRQYEDRWKIARAMFEYGFSRYTKLNVDALLSEIPQVSVEVLNAQSAVLCEYPNIKVHEILVTSAAANAILCGEIDVRHEVDELVRAPISKGDVVGTVTYVNRNSGVVLFEGALIAAQDVSEAALPTIEPIKTPYSPQELPIAVGITSATKDSGAYSAWFVMALWAAITLAITIAIYLIFWKKNRRV